MGYIENNLVDGERVLYRAKISWTIFFLPVLLSIILIWLASKIAPIAVIIVVIFGIFVIGSSLLTFLTTEFALTDRRIIAKKGIFRQRSLEIMLNKIESVSISQSLGQRILGFGTVTVTGSGGTEEYFKSISRPTELQKQVNSQIAKL